MTNRRVTPIAAAAALLAAASVSYGTAHAQYRSPGPEERLAMAVTPDLGLPLSVVEAAGAYRTYIGGVAGTPDAFADGGAIARSVRTGAAYEPKQLTRGAAAYAAIVALQSPRFMRSVREAAADPFRGDRLAREIFANPQAAMRFDGAAEAAGLILAAVGDDGSRLSDIGARVKQASYDVQHEPWSKGEVDGRDHRLAEAKLLSGTPLSADGPELARLTSAALGGSGLDLGPAAAAESYAPVVVRGLAVAALAGLGAAGEDSAAEVEALLDDQACSECLRMSKLNLFQCLAVAKPWYEDVWCLGVHGLKDTGDCLQAASREPAAASLRAEPAVIRQRWREEWRSESGWTRY